MAPAAPISTDTGTIRGAYWHEDCHGLSAQGYGGMCYFSTLTWLTCLAFSSG